jgi:hypothetical protein
MGKVYFSDRFSSWFLTVSALVALLASLTFGYGQCTEPQEEVTSEIVE